MAAAPPVKFKTTSVVPPAIQRDYTRESPYAPSDQVPGMWAALVTARQAADADKTKAPWVSFISNALPKQLNARTAADSIRGAVVKYAELESSKMLAARVWGSDEEGWYFALSIRSGALDVDAAGE
jgi:hypothetical protein